MKMFFRPIRDIAEKYNVMQNAMASAERLFLLLDNTEKLPVPARPAAVGIMPDLPALEPIREIRFDDVTFSYVASEPVLKNVSFRIRSGETLAVVGPTGSGKTSLINLILRFYDPVSGQVVINGHDIRGVAPDVLRARMALVTQDPYLFSASVRENIIPENGGFSDTEMDRLLAKSNCTDLVANLPQGLDTMIGEGGRSVSSGERQLISIARAFARHPDLIILDEATSYIDSETEEKLQGAVDNLMAGRTAIVVAHRLSTARSADRIMVLNRGMIIESGTHEELLDARGFYARMVQLQQ
jgi:ATP-binding cassette subfamily B protein